MSTLITIPFFGKDDGLQRLFPTLGLAYPGLAAFAEPCTFIPFAYGEVLVRNNNIENVGFTKACNDGLNVCVARGHDCVWIMGDDMIVPALGDVVQGIEAEFAAHPATGIIGLQLREMENPDFIYHGGTKEAYPVGIHKSGLASQGAYAARSRERWAPGGAMVVHKKCIEQVGLMDERFFLICSDSDYGYRARAAGFDVVYLPLPLLHKSGGISQEPAPAQLELLKRDIAAFEAKWLSDPLFHKLDKDPL